MLSNPGSIIGAWLEKIDSGSSALSVINIVSIDFSSLDFLTISLGRSTFRLSKFGLEIWEDDTVPSISLECSSINLS